MAQAEVTRFRTASDEIVSDVIEGEAVVVDLATGAYYTMNATGAVLWELLRAGCSRAELYAAASAALEGDATAVRGLCDAFVSRLLDEGLIAADGARSSRAELPRIPQRIPFQPPSLVKFTDMEDLLSLDPVHEVDDLGWPHPTSVKTS